MGFLKTCREILCKVANAQADILSGLATAIFSMPEGMAYAKLAGVNPIYGLYSGMIATITAAMSTGTVLMISTLTSSIAISTHSVLNLAGIESENLASALFTLTFLVGAVMLVMGLLRLGKIVDFVSNAVMTGFVTGASVLIIFGELADLTGIAIPEMNKFSTIYHWIFQYDQWNFLSAAVGFGSIFFMSLMQKIPKLKEISSFLVLMIATLIVNLNQWNSVERIGQIAEIPNQLPSFILPDLSMAPQLLLGAISIAMIAVTQGAGVSTVTHNPDGTEPSHSRDFIGEGIGNVFGSFFQSMPTGGSLSRTSISLNTGAKSRLAGISSGLWLIFLVYYLGKMIEHIPVPCIAGILCVIAYNIVVWKYQDIKLILTTSLASSLVMIATFLATLLIPLQWAIFFGALLSFLVFAYTSATKIRLMRWVQHKDGHFYKEHVPHQLKSNELVILDYEGNAFFGEVPAIRHHMPSIDKVHGSVIIWRMRGVDDVHSTFLKWLKQFVIKFQAQGNLFLLEGVEKHAMKQLKHSNIIKTIGNKHVYPAHKGILVGLEKAVSDAKQWMEKRS